MSFTVTTFLFDNYLPFNIFSAKSTFDEIS